MLKSVSRWAQVGRFYPPFFPRSDRLFHVIVVGVSPKRAGLVLAIDKKRGADIAASSLISCSGRRWGSFAAISIQWGRFPPHFPHFSDTAKYVCVYTVVDFKLCKSANAHAHAQTNKKIHSDTTTNTMLKIQSDGFAFNTKEKICVVLELYKIDGLEAWYIRPKNLDPVDRRLRVS